MQPLDYCVLKALQYFSLANKASIYKISLISNTLQENVKSFS